MRNAVLANDEAVLAATISHFLKFGARAESDARWFVSILPADLQAFFRSEFMEAIRTKVGNDPVKNSKAVPVARADGQDDSWPGIFAYEEAARRRIASRCTESG